MDVGDAVSSAVDHEIPSQVEDYSEEGYIALLKAVDNPGSYEHVCSTSSFVNPSIDADRSGAWSNRGSYEHALFYNVIFNCFVEAADMDPSNTKRDLPCCWHCLWFLLTLSRMDLFGFWA